VSGLLGCEETQTCIKLLLVWQGRPERTAGLLAWGKQVWGGGYVMRCRDTCFMLTMLCMI
jgi:hypothetical protein